jgi:glycosyltransferase involved in cell wall biosynthesis
MVSVVENRKIMIANFGNLFISHGIYADQLSTALTPNSVLWSFLRSSKDKKEVFPGNTVFSVYSQHLGLNYIKFNRLLNPYFFKFSSCYKETRENGGLIHYAAPSFPIDNNLDDIVTIHDLFALMHKEEATRQEILSLSYFLKMKNIVTVSNASKEEIHSLGSEGDVEVIYPPTRKEMHHLNDKNGIRKELGLPLDKILILSVSNSQPRKNLAIVKELSRTLPNDCRIVRVGEGFDNTINFRDIEMYTLNKVFNSCDLLLMPSFREGFGSPLAEALTVGIPAVASDIDIFREIGADAVVYFEPNDIKGLMQAIREALTSSENLIEKGKERAKKFSFEAFKENIHRYYNNKFGFKY